jgi:Calcineurin-like phosphoesterase.
MQSNARVIENKDRKDLSPEIGQLVNNSGMNFINLLNNGAGASDIDMVWIVGDFVDFIKNIYPIKQLSNQAAVWKMVALDDTYETRYVDYVDYISVYSIIVDFYKKHQKPIFGVKGNHDCYYQPYGISPRIAGGKANDGIPADHNLTFYEALLAFGETYGVLKKYKNFKSEHFEWFALIFSPLMDYSIDLPKQVIVGLGWGDEEDLYASPTDTSQGKVAHLPRADGSISTKQLKVIDDAVKTNKKVILASHFTFVSYTEEITEDSSKAGSTVVPGKYGRCDMGTFETNRDEVLGVHLGKRKDIQCVISGHSHRRAAYEIVKAEQTTETVASGESGDVYSYDKYTLSTKMHVFDKYNGFNPVVIVTDSAGPIPRRNIRGEFGKWGSDNASGTKVLFDKGSGNLSAISRVASGCQRAKPRIAVAIDYYDILVEEVFTKFRSNPYQNKHLSYGTIDSVSFNIDLTKLHGWGVRISSIILSLFDGSVWSSIKFQDVFNSGVWSISGNEGSLLYNFCKQSVGIKNIQKFLSFFLDDHNISTHLGSYDFKSSWNIEADLLLEKQTSIHSFFILKRSNKFKEEPNYDLRRTLNDKYK